MSDPSPLQLAATDPTVLFLRKTGTSYRVDPSKLYQPFCVALFTVLRATARRGVLMYPTRGFATFHEQDALHQDHLRGGPRAAPAGFSAHNYGIAVDFARDTDPETPGLQGPDYSAKGFKVFLEEVARHPLLASGVSFGDRPHVGLVGYESARALDPLHRVWLAAPAGHELPAVWAYLNERAGS